MAEQERWQKLNERWACRLWMSRMNMKVTLLLWGAAALPWAIVSCASTDLPSPEGAATETPAEEQAETSGVLPDLPDFLAGRDAVSVDQLTADRAEDTVAISGEVTNRVALLEGWLYQVQDETGQIWIVADGSDPEIGQQVTVEGIVRYETIQVESINAGEVYLEETRYRAEE